MHDSLQTERYSLNDFTYELNVPAKDGDYVLVLKFSEVYFNEQQKKVGNAQLTVHAVRSLHSPNMFS
jgi:Malectin domain